MNLKDVGKMWEKVLNLKYRFLHDGDNKIPYFR